MSSYNKFKNTEIKDVNSLGYAINTIGNIICDSSIKTDNIESKTTNGNVTIKNTIINDINNLGYALTTSGNIICNSSVKTDNIESNTINGNVTIKNTLINDSNSLGYALTTSGNIICNSSIKTDNIESKTTNGNVTIKNALINDSNSLGYALTTSGNIICNSSIKTDNIESKTTNGNVKIKRCLNIDIGTGGKCIDLASGDTRRTNNNYGTIQYNNFGSGIVLFGDQTAQRVDIFNNLFVHGTLNLDSNFYLNSILYCNSIGAQNNNALTLNSNDGQNIFIGYYKVSAGGKVIINRSCNASSSVDIEQGNLNMKNDSVATIYCNQIKDYSNISYLKSSVFNNSITLSGLINNSTSTFNANVLLKNDALTTFYCNQIIDYSNVSYLKSSVFNNSITLSGLINNSTLNQNADLNVKNDALTTIYCNQIKDYSNISYLKSSVFNNSITLSGLINNSTLNQNGDLNMKNDALTTIYCNQIKDYAGNYYLINSANATLNNLNVTKIYTSDIDIKGGLNTVNLFSNASNIYIGNTLTCITTIKAYLEVTELGTFKRGIQCDDSSTFTGINNTTPLNNDGVLNQTDHIYLSSNKSIYISDGTSTTFATATSNFMRLIHSGIQGFIDYTGNFNIRNRSATTTFKIDGVSHEATFNYNLNCNGIINTGNIKNSNHLLMKADGAQSIYFTTDGNTVSSNNCIGRFIWFIWSNVF